MYLHSMNFRIPHLVYGALLFCGVWLNAQSSEPNTALNTLSKTTQLYGPVVIPVVLPAHASETMNWQQGEDYWLTIRFYAQPDGNAVFEEMAERL